MKKSEKDKQRQEIIERARTADLAEYLLGKGVELIRNGNRYKDKVHDSLVFTNNLYYWNVKSEWGNAVDYLTRYMGLSFNDAVKELTGISIQNIKESKIVRDVVIHKDINLTIPYLELQKKMNDTDKISFLVNEYKIKPSEAEKAIKKYRDNKSVKPFSIDNLTLEKDMRRSIAYLNKTRNIDANIIQRLIDGKYLYQQLEKVNLSDDKKTETHNILFPMYDENKKIVGAEKTGTLSYAEKRYKGIEENSKYGYGFNICTNKPLNTVYFFESAIDLISFIELEKMKGNRLNNSLLVSMAGVKIAVFENMIKYFQCENAVKCICVDNDEAGKKFYLLTKEKYPDVKLLLCDNGKDWNEKLKDIKTHGSFDMETWRNEIQKQRAEQFDNDEKDLKKVPHREEKGKMNKE